MTNTIKRLTVLTIIFSLWGCEKSENMSTSIPNRPVNIVINTKTQHQFNEPYYRKSYNDQGYGGVLVINYSSGLEVNLAAFDKACPYEAAANNRVDSLNILQVQCPKCKSIFEIGDGTGRCKSGPSTERLRKYYINKNGDTYRIQN